MKPIALFFAFVLPALLLSAQDTIPNPGFENWSPNPNYDKPTSWTSLNALTYLLGKITCTKSTTDFHSGAAAVKLVSMFITPSDFGPAVVTTGSINPSGIYGGIPISSRPTAVTGWYKYFPLGSDQALFEIYLYKNGTVIGTGTFQQPDSVTEWTQFSFPVNYTSTDVPDTVLLNFFASTGGDSPPAEENSTLLIDDLAYDFTSGIHDKADALPLNIYPNPASGKMVFENNVNIATLDAYTLQGKMVKQFSVHTGKNTLDVSMLDAGIYLITAVGVDGAKFSDRITIQR